MEDNGKTQGQFNSNDTSFNASLFTEQSPKISLVENLNKTHFKQYPNNSFFVQDCTIRTIIPRDQPRNTV